MKKLLLFLLIVSFCLSCSTGNRRGNGFKYSKLADSLLNEGKFLYRLEKASWISAEDFRAKFPEFYKSLGGYFSYEQSTDCINTVYYDKSSPAKVLIRYRFDRLPKSTDFAVDTLHPEMNEAEKDLLSIRTDAVRMVSEDEGSFFRIYERTSFNFIPFVKNGEKKVVILTSPQNHEVLLGNDYELTYDQSNKLLNRKRIHNTLINLTGSGNEGNTKDGISYHTHVLSDYIDPTDICTLMLYSSYLETKLHAVIGPKYLSLFNIQSELLFILPIEAFSQRPGPKKKLATQLEKDLLNYENHAK